MTSLNGILLLLFVSAGSMATQRSHRSKRGLLDLAGVIKCSTGRSALSYMSYGCYCGLGGKGWPLDRADWCCHKHDCCFGEAEKYGCTTKTRGYYWRCDDGKPECEDPNDKCAKMVCECDIEIAKCLGKVPYLEHFVMWPRFWCGYKEPTCSIY